MKPIMVVTAPVGTRSGYGAHSRDICRSLIDLEKFDVRILKTIFLLNGKSKHQQPSWQTHL